MLKKRNNLIMIMMVAVIAIFCYAQHILQAEENSGGEVAAAADTKAINQELEQKKARINQLQDQINEYQKNIDYQRQQTFSLANQLSILTSEVNKLNTEIDLKNNQIDSTKLEIETTTERLDDTNKSMAEEKEKLSYLMRKMNRLDQQSALEVLLSTNSFSEYYNHLHTLSVLQSEAGQSIDNLGQMKKDLENTQAQLTEKQKQLEGFIVELDQKKDNLESRSYAKKSLLSESKQSEAKFKTLVAQLKAEQSTINADLIALEKKMRQKLSQGENQLGALGSAIFNWPSVTQIVTAYFHDPDYPFRYVFEHPAIDIKSPQGSPVEAASSGYVGTARIAGLGYNYVMLIHGDGFSTVYGHLSKIIVEPDEFVSSGQVIGYSGGMPGTPGAGRLSTGPHLHFEIRKNGIPVNPLDFLP